MTSRFLNMIPWLWQWEGTKYENDPDDPGGATKFGIDQRSHPNENIRTLTEERATEIYWNEYWQRNGCERMPAPLGEVFFNCCVNAGRGRADKIMRVAGQDAERFLDEQDDFYRRLAAQRPKSKKYLKGWLNRTESLRQKLNLK